jgi:L-threonylcarbamoyladenylate synthase
MMPILPASEENLRKAAIAITQGGLVALPTETVYGLGANALDAMALARIFEVKRRPFFDPLIVHVADREALETLCLKPDARAEKLMEKFWPGPLTLVLPKTDRIPELATSGLPTVALRMPAHPVALRLLRLAGVPIAAPSANPFGRLSPTTAAHVQNHFAEGIEFILDGGPCSVGVESTILSLASETPVLLRAGGLPIEEIEALIGPVALAESLPAKPLAPGQLPGHYAPRTWLRLRDRTMSIVPDPKTAKPRRGLLAFQSVPEDSIFFSVEILSPTGNLREAAANLFACLHRLDRLGLDWIEAETLSGAGLGAAIMDRLQKAATGSRSSP